MTEPKTLADVQRLKKQFEAAYGRAPSYVAIGKTAAAQIAKDIDFSGVLHSIEGMTVVESEDADCLEVQSTDWVNPQDKTGPSE